MGHGLDVCMADPREAQTIEECLESEFVRTLVCQAGLVISGHKPAAVFGFTPRAWRGGDHRQKRALSARLLATYASSTRRYGLCLAGLSRHADGLMLLAWRPSQVEKIVADAQSRAFLDSVGLPSGDASALMAELVGRLRAYYAGRASFPTSWAWCWATPSMTCADSWQTAGAGPRSSAAGAATATWRTPAAALTSSPDASASAA